MSDPRRNAAIWYAVDGYDPETKGVNGRRVAGASFLKGFARHADVDEFVCLSESPRGGKRFTETMRGFGAHQPIRRASFHNARKISPVGTVYYPAPNFASELWRRQSLGPAAYAVCGITHTTATNAVMQGMVDLRNAPQMEWDAVICTSNAVKASQNVQLDMIDAFQRERFGKVPPRPQMPVIPLGLNCDDFAHVASARKALRGKKGWGRNDIVVATLSRLTPYGKFDPFPLFMALEAAQAELGTTRKLHFVACGIYVDKHSQKVFVDGARALMPSVSFTLLDGKDENARRATLSGADIFTFPIDNIQETFGLAPIEAMAAGLPVVTTDWDGMRDTVTDDVGIRVPTRGLGPRHTGGDGWSYLSKRTSYAQYGNNLSAMTEVDLAAMTQAFVTLARDAELRKRMGAAGLKRALDIYDWSKIIPQYQDLWAELSAIRQRLGTVAQGLKANPAAPAPTKLFGPYPSETMPKGIGRCIAQACTVSIAEMFELRQYTALKNPFEKPQTLQKVFDAVEEMPDGADAEQIAKQLRFNLLTVERCYAWLLKYGYLKRA
ncbi:glycosyltransferase family 4 protein [Lentibacter algarum]|uniref:glycosyltransferase family 4 protein n=1 Tax=Lentibacter algarum TaxID=576131 RepID=UPI001C08D296|nr:glycosyltransferase family 4 protein [Lentibacter algarum]MBU2982543.1 glycosyltransferase family 4 protein [Lentibacter algarum]